jgi:hypothetical protein
VYERHRRWSADGTWDKIFAAALADADAEGRIDWWMVSVDSTSCLPHQHAAGAGTKPPPYTCPAGLPGPAGPEGPLVPRVSPGRWGQREAPGGPRGSRPIVNACWTGQTVPTPFEYDFML